MIVAEELLYGWARRGVEGSNRLQLVTTSEGWSRDTRHRRVAQRLCRYAEPNGSNLSFGFVDVGGLRYVFNRRMVPGIAGGAPGLAAHVIAMEPALLPVRQILDAFGSDYWWDGSDLDGGTLRKPFSLSYLAPGPMLAASVDDGDVDCLVEMILQESTGRPICVEGNDLQVMALLRGIAARLPSLLEGLSFSTREQGEAVEWFGVVGTEPGRTPRSLPAFQAAQQRAPRYQPDQLEAMERIISTALHSVTGSMGSKSARGFRSLVNIGAEIAADPCAQIDHLIRDATTLAMVLSTDHGMEAVVRTVSESRLESWPTISDPAGIAPRLKLLGALVAERIASRPSVSPGRFLSRLRTIHPAASAAFLELFADRVVDGSALPPPDRDISVSLLQWSAESLMPARQRSVVENYCFPVVDAQLLTEASIAIAPRAALFERASKSGVLSPADYSLLFRREPALFQGKGWLDFPLAKVASVIIGADAAFRSELLRALSCSLSNEGALLLARELSDRGDWRAAMSVAACLQSRRRLVAADQQMLGDLISDALLRTLSSEADLNPLRDIPWPAVALLTLGDYGWLHAASDAIRRMRRCGTHSAVRAWIDAIQSVNHQRELLRLACFCLALENPSPDQLREQLYEISPWGVFEADDLLDAMIVAVRCAGRQGRFLAGVLVCAAAAFGKASGLSRRVRRPPILESETRRALLGAAPGDVGALHEYLESQPRELRQWFRDLSPG